MAQPASADDPEQLSELAPGHPAWVSDVFIYPDGRVMLPDEVVARLDLDGDIISCFVVGDAVVLRRSPDRAAAIQLLAQVDSGEDD